MSDLSNFINIGANNAVINNIESVTGNITGGNILSNGAITGGSVNTGNLNATLSAKLGAYGQQIVGGAYDGSQVQVGTGGGGQGVSITNNRGGSTQINLGVDGGTSYTWTFNNGDGTFSGPSTISTSGGLQTGQDINSSGGSLSVAGQVTGGGVNINAQTIAGLTSGANIDIDPSGSGILRTLNGVEIFQGAYANLPLFSVSQNGVVSTLVPNATSYLGAFEVVGNPTATTVPPQNYGVMIHTTGVPGAAGRIYNDGVGAYAAIVNRRYNGTSGAPTGVLSGEVVGRYAATPMLSNLAFPTLSTTRIDMIATEIQTPSNQGSRMEFYTVPQGGNTVTLTMQLDAINGILMTGNILPTSTSSYNLGNATNRWGNIWVGPTSINMQDTVTLDNAELTVTNGVLKINGASKIQVGNMQMTSTGISLVTANTGSNIQIGTVGDTGYVQVNMPGIKFASGNIQLDAGIATSERAVANGVATLNPSGVVWANQLPAGATVFLGTWDAGNNTPTLADGTGTAGDQYIVNVGGTQNLGNGSITFGVGDQVLYNTNGQWIDIPAGIPGVTSFNGNIGAVILTNADVLGALANNSINNNKLANSNITVNTGQGISLTGSSTVALGNTITLTNTGILSIIPGTGVTATTSAGNTTISIGQPVGTANSVQFAGVFANTTIQATGNITAGNLITSGNVAANGSININGSFFAPNTSIAYTGAISTAGSVTASAYYGDGSGLTNLTGSQVSGYVNDANYATVAGTVNQGTQTAITTVGTLTNLSVAGNVSVAGNISGNNLSINSINAVSGNIAAGNFLTGGLVSATGNVTGGNVLTGGAVSATGTITGTSHLGAVVSATANITGGNILTGGLISATGNLQAGNIRTAGQVSATGNITGAATITGLGNATTGILAGVFGTANVALHANAVVTSAGNANSSAQFALQNNSSLANASTDLALYNNLGTDSQYFINMGIVSSTYNGSAAGANVFSANDGYLYVVGNSETGPVGSGAGVGNLILGATNGQVITWLGNVSTANIITVTATTGFYVTGLITATGNVTGGNVRTTGLITATGNITGGNILTGGLVSATGNITSTANVTGGNGLTGGLISATGTITGTSHLGAVVSVTANITGGNVLTGGLISATSTITSAANVTGGNLLTGGLVSATGTITGTSHLGAVVSVTANITGGNLLTGGLISATSTITSAANVTGGNILTGGLVSATSTVTGSTLIGSVITASGNVTGGNILTGGLVSAVGNITGNYIIGNGSQLTALTGSAVTGQVANALVAGTVYTNAQPNITSVGILSSVSVTGNTQSGNLLTGGLISSTGNITSGNILTGGLISAAGGITTDTTMIATGNIRGGNVNVNGLINASGNVTGANILTGGLISATGAVTSAANITGGNILTGGLVSATGNVTGNYLIGNGSAITGTVPTANTATNLSAATSILAGAITIDPASIGKNTAATQTFTLTGLTTNHKIVITSGTAMPALNFWITAAWPSAANTLSVQFMNASGGAIDSGTLDIHYFAWV